MICQPNNWNTLQMLEKLSTQAIYYRPPADGPTGISNTAIEKFVMKSIKCLGQQSVFDNNFDPLFYYHYFLWSLILWKWFLVCISQKEMRYWFVKKTI